jgi:hypothetical protein
MQEYADSDQPTSIASAQVRTANVQKPRRVLSGFVTAN